jgi:hypothetical protein
VWEALIRPEELTNPRVRDEVGTIALIPPEERVSGPGASHVMASFTHLNPKGSRFSDGSYGVYCAASALETAIAETVFHSSNSRATSNSARFSCLVRELEGCALAHVERLSAPVAENPHHLQYLFCIRVAQRRRPVSAGFKGNVSRGKSIGHVSSEWFSQPERTRLKRSCGTRSVV